MVDYTRGTGAAGTMLIRDTGWSVEFYIQSGYSSTFVGSLAWSGFVNGGGRGGSFAYPSGSPWVLVHAENVSSTQDVRFSIGASGTSGLGGPTDFWQRIERTPPDTRTPPSAPGNPTFSEITPTSVRISWAASGSTGGAAIDAYLLRRKDTPGGSYVDHSQENNRTRLVTGLTPGRTYYWSVYAHNVKGYSPQTAEVPLTMPTGARVKVGGVWKLAIPYVKVGGVWKQARPYVKVGGTWKPTA
jgi:hypothetical protein